MVCAWIVNLVLSAVLFIGSQTSAMAQVRVVEPTEPLDRAPSAALLHAATQGGLEALAKSLVASSLSTSLIFRWEDKQAQQPALPNGRAAALSDVRAALRAFQERHPWMLVDERPGGMRLTTSAPTACARVARKRIAAFRYTGEAFGAIYALVRTANADTSPFVPPGLVGGDVGSDTPYRTLVSLSLVDTTVEEALDEIARQSPGVGWAIRDTPPRFPDQGGERRCYVTLFGSDSWLETSHVLTK